MVTERRLDLYSFEKELARKWQAKEINPEQYLELLYDAIAVRLSIQYPGPVGLPREDHNPVRSYRRLLHESRSVA